MKSISVLMSTYYKENPNYLNLALNSVVNQTYKPKEIILVEDGKLTNELYGVIDKYEKKYPNLFNVIKRDENKGLGYSLREGLEHCRYEIIARMDTDDIAKKNRFESQIKYFENSNICIVGSNITEYDESMKNVLSRKCVPEKNIEIKKYLKKRNPFNHMSVMFRKKSVLEVGSYEDVPFFEDYYLWCKLLILDSNEAYNIQDFLVDVRGGSSMYGRRGGLKYNKCIYNFEKKIYKLGIISRFELWKNVLIRVMVSIIPNELRKFLYTKLLRKKA